MQFAIGVTILECSFVKHSHGPLGVKKELCLFYEFVYSDGLLCFPF
jgi:hypothetical protein